MKIFVLVAGWAITLGALVAISVTLVMCFCDPRDKKEEQLEETKPSMANSHEEEYVLDQTAAEQDN